MTTAVEVLERVGREAWMPTAVMPVDEWADTHRVLAARGAASAEPGRWDTGRTPYWREPMRAYADPRVRRITACCSSQIGKTEFTLNCQLYALSVERHSLLVVYPTESDAKDICQDRLVPAMEESPTLRTLLPVRREDMARTRINLSNGVKLWFAWARSKRTAKSRPVPRVFGDEIDEWPDIEILHDLLARMKTYPDAKLVLVSSPKDEGLGIDGQYTLSDRERYHVPCPHCGRFQELVFDRVRWHGGRRAHPDDVARHAWYECLHCGGRIRNRHKPAMLADGIWLAEGEKIEGTGHQASGNGGRGSSQCPMPNAQCLSELDGTRMREDGTEEYEALARRGFVIETKGVRRGSHRGYQLSALYSPFETFGSVARGFVEAGCRQTPDWRRNMLGMPWAVRSYKVDTRELIAQARDSEYVRGEVPAGVLCLTFASDIQGDRAIWEVRGWGERGADTWLIDYGQIAAPMDGGLTEVDQVFDWTYEQEQEGVTRHLRLVAWAFDSGWRTAEVYGLGLRAKARGGGGLGDRVWMVKGQSTRREHPFRVTHLETYPDGTKMPTSIRLLNVNTDLYKQRAMALIRGETIVVPGPDGPVVQTGKFHLPSDVSHSYLAQITAEHRIEEKGRYVWRLKTAGRDNHWGDALVYQLAVADRMGVRNLTRADIERARGRVKDDEAPVRRPEPTYRQRGWTPRRNRS